MKMNDVIFSAGGPAVAADRKDADLICVTAPVGNYPFFSLTLENTGVTFERSGDGGAGGVDLLDGASGEPFARISDRAVAEGALLRTVVTSRRLTFAFAADRRVDRAGVRQSGGYTAFWLRMRAGISDPGRAPSAESYMMISVIGDAAPVDDHLVCMPGESALLICGGYDPDEVVRRMRAATAKYAKNSLKSDIPASLKKADGVIAVALETLLARRTREGAVVSSLARPVCDPVTRYLCVRAFSAAGLKDEARAAARAYLDEWKRNGRLIWSGVGTVAELRSANEGSLTPALAILTVKHVFGGEPPEEFLPMISDLVSAQAAQLCGHALPFNGNEGHPVARYCPDHGSAAATALFIVSAEFALAVLDKAGYPASNGLAEKTAAARESFHRNFTADGNPLLNSPRRLNSRPVLPAMRFGYCAVCSPELRDPPPKWTALSPLETYVCFDCADAAAKAEPKLPVDPAVRHTDLMSAIRCDLLESGLYLRGMVRQIIRALLSEPPASLRPYEYGLLLRGARKHGLEPQFLERAEELARESIRRPDADSAALAAYVAARLEK